MSKKDFVVKKIKSLKQIRPDSSWLLSQKSFLLSEISQAQNKKKKTSLVLPLFNFNVLKIFKPAFAIALVIIVLISSLATIGVISAAQNSLPGDFLYPLKTAFEQTQLTFTANEVSKTKLSIKFATQRMDEFTRLVDRPEKKKDIEKTIQSFTNQMVSVRENIDKLKEKNAQKAAEVAKLIKAQAPIYKKTLTESSDKLANIIPGDKENLEKNIDQALTEIDRTIEEPSVAPTEPGEQITSQSEGSNEEQILVPQEQGTTESESVPFENLNKESTSYEEQPQGE